MYLMYVDESGDSGIEKSPTQHFILSGLVIHETFWNAITTSLIAKQRELRKYYEILEPALLKEASYEDVWGRVFVKK